jgi:hypothetical protein
MKKHVSFKDTPTGISIEGVSPDTETEDKIFVNGCTIGNSEKGLKESSFKLQAEKNLIVSKSFEYGAIGRKRSSSHARIIVSGIGA